MAETGRGPRELIAAELVTRAQQDVTFRQQLTRDPRATIERALGIKLPADLSIAVHEETPDALHVVLPLSVTTFNDVILAQTELGDREVQGFADKTDPYEGEESHKLLPSTARRG